MLDFESIGSSTINTNISQNKEKKQTAWLSLDVTGS